MLDIENVAELAALRDAMAEHLDRTEVREARGEGPDLYDSETVADVLDRAEMELARQGY